MKSRRSGLGFLMLAMAMVASAGVGGFGSRREKPKLYELSDEEKEKIQKKYESRFHKYVINGVEIEATNKVEARKKYKARYGNKK